jgi:hypothetical protein
MHASIATCGMQDPRKLRIWRLACELAVAVRAATDRFPKRGYAELKSQIITACAAKKVLADDSE